jgi:DNA-binding CsgD family transcriptional regulator/PAS domain-containing protein
MPARLVSRILDAALVPGTWPAALDEMSRETGAAGGAYILRDKRTGQVDWISLAGLSAGLERDYQERFAALDPFLPMQEVAPLGKWLRLRECLPEATLRDSEWYNDFVLKSGIVDTYGVRLFDNWAYSAFIGLHQATTGPPLEPARFARLDEMFEPLNRAVRIHVEFHGNVNRALLASRALDHIPIGVIIADCTGRAIEINRAAERMIGKHDGLVLRGGRLGTNDPSAAARLLKFIAAAATDDPAPDSGGRMLLSRPGTSAATRNAYAVTVAPLTTRMQVYERPFALILVVDLAEGPPNGPALTEIFGLTAMERRLATTLMAGLSLGEIAKQQGVRIATLRSQVSSILRKVGVARQADLMRTLAAVRMVSGR